MTDFDFELSKELAQKAVDLAEKHGFDEILSYALSSLGLCFWDDQDHALALLRRGRDLVVENGFSGIAPHAFGNYAINFSEHFRHKEYDEGINYCHQNEISSGVMLMTAWRLEPLEMMGERDVVWSKSAELILSDIKHFSVRFYFPLVRTRIAMRRGLSEADELFAHLENMIDHGRDTAIPQSLRNGDRQYVCLVRSCHRWLSGWRVL